MQNNWHISHYITIVTISHIHSKIFNLLSCSSIEQVCTSLLQNLKEEKHCRGILAPKDNSNFQLNMVEITISNIICKFSSNCALDLHEIALRCTDVEYKPTNKFLTMRLRIPSATANVWASGKVVCLGTTNEKNAKIAARRFGRIIQKLGFDVQIGNFRIVNVFGTANMPFNINTEGMAKTIRNQNVGANVKYQLKCKLSHLHATVNIYYTGSITISAPSEKKVKKAFEYIGHIVNEFRIVTAQE